MLCGFLRVYLYFLNSIFFFCVNNAVGNLKIFYIFTGGIFDDENYETEVSFRYAIIRENMYNPKIELVPIIKKVDPSDSFQTEKIGSINN